MLIIDTIDCNVKMKWLKRILFKKMGLCLIFINDLNMAFITF